MGDRLSAHALMPFSCEPHLIQRSQRFARRVGGSRLSMSTELPFSGRHCHKERNNICEIAIVHARIADKIGCSRSILLLVGIRCRRCSELHCLTRRSHSTTMNLEI